MSKAILTFRKGTKKLDSILDMITDVVVPDSVNSIGNSAFAGCMSLTKITIPNSVTFIGNCAFDCCLALTEITIPDSVECIGQSAFFRCFSLKSIYINKEKDSLDLRYTGIPENCKVYWKGEF